MKTINIQNKVTDNFKRPLISLRISITNRCNVKCFYCHHDGIVPQDYEMTPKEIERIVTVAKELGIEKIRLSGGEPLIREDIVDMVSKIANVGFRDISLTTNGILLEKYAEKLHEAGLTRVNVSFDTLNPETYRFITKRDYMENAKAGIQKAVESGLNPVKVNMVVMKGINDNEIWDMFQFCRETGAILQLIELLKTEADKPGSFFDEYHYDMGELEDELTEMSDQVKTRKFMQDRKKYFVEGGEIEIVRPMDNTEFCKNCTRLRITPDGKIKPCLLKNDNLVDIIEPMRRGYTNKELKNVFLEAIEHRKPYFTNGCHAKS
ncbi:molybdenum cofactor biosynthesis protein A [Methanobacterium lacus]|uniref:Probable GTP 3',8-cyclase n=1 Tax=Methanobacterium lacus (strain AL-21) TaxID=877455 RepID=F0T796_METLA|nr:GTP 3',8-cyclase MoaA [Methanobacterium lacus]ADZ10730.1 molybdenum cofactor biosynthesis protein A [Methanobacterium lacus]